jgi:hypothetical protein
MNRLLSPLVIVAVIVVCLCVSAARAAEPTSNYEHLKVLEPLVGTWDVLFKLDDGSTMSSRVSFEWGKGRNFILAQWRFEGDKEISGVEVFGWDATTNGIKLWNFIYDGSRNDAAWSIEGDTWTGKYHTVLPDGQKAELSVVMRWKGKDSLTYELTPDKGPGTRATAESKRVK